MLILANLREFVKAHFIDIMLVLIIVLLVLLSFGVGFIIGKYQNKAALQINEYPKTHSFIS